MIVLQPVDAAMMQHNVVLLSHFHDTKRRSNSKLSTVLLQSMFDLLVFSLP